MSKVVETTVYEYQELDDTAKERALSWYASTVGGEVFAEGIIDDFANICDVLGVTLATQTVPLMNGGTRQKPVIYYSGFGSQGDGACFEGRYEYKRGSCKSIRSYAPNDTELHRIADALRDVQKPHFYRLAASMAHSGHYYHSGWMDVTTTDDSTGRDVPEVEQDVQQLMRDLADWLYAALREEYYYQTSEEVAIDMMEANEYMFTESGEPA